MIDFSKLNFSKLNGLIPAVIQDAATRQVLMIGFMNHEALEKTIKDGKVTFWSRSKQRFWQKGETSGNTLELISLRPDCDGDALLVQVHPTGPTCHTGTSSCFGEELSGPVLQELERIIQHRKSHMPANSYTAKLFAGGTPAISQKIGEEASEVIVAAMQADDVALKEESADLLYHFLVLLADRGLKLDDVLDALKARM